MPNSNGPAESFDSDPPIVIQGGGSVDMDVPSKFKEKSSGSKGKRFKHDIGNLVSIVIDGKTTPLNKNSRIEINYE